ncbi:MAG: DmsE family decaheme c-type cytochrome [bacterium]|nr:DmsE family decaheme c-type cytochrome [bacterium]
MLRLLILIAGLLTLLAVVAAAGGGFAERVGVPSGAAYVGSQACLDCHDEAGAFYQHTPHSVERAAIAPGTGASACEACHGPGSLHVEAGGEGPIFGRAVLSALDAEDRAEMCLQCHQDKRATWSGSPHAGGPTDCAACHTDVVHGGGSAQAPSAFRIAGEFCLQCHAAQAADFRLPFRHRVLEGEVSCQDCHAVHGAAPAAAPLGDLNAACLNCHTEMAGPFLFEHEAVSAEDCTACHRPHGSINDKLLTQDGNSLCLQCHFEPGYPTIGGVNHGGFLGSEARCYDCHHEIHGSNLNPTFLD